MFEDSEKRFDVFDTTAAAAAPDVVKSPRRTDFIQGFCKAYRIAPDDTQELLEYIQSESSRVFVERFARLMEFFQRCRIPKLYVFAMIATGGQMDMPQIARACGVSKQAVHKAFRSMEPVFNSVGRFDTRRRQFRNENHKQQRPNHARVNGDG